MRPSLRALAVLALLLVPVTATARPFDAARVPATSSAVGHVDVDALRTTQIYAALSALAGAKKADLDIPAEVRPLVEYAIGAIRGVSFWVGTGDTGALVVEVADGAKMGAMLDRLPHEGERTLAGVKVRSHRLDGESFLLARSGNLFVMSDDEASMTRSLDVLARRATSLDRRKLPAATRDRGVFFFAALDEKLLDRVSQSASSQVLKAELESLAITIGEVKGELRGRATAEVGDAADAQQIKTVLEGLKALVALADDAKQLAPLVNSMRVTVHGKQVEVSLALRSTDLIRALQSMK